MTELVSMLRERAIDRDFAALGLDFESLFNPEKSGGKANPYGGYEWLVKTVPRFGRVINAVPPDGLMEQLPWEEWYQLQGVRHHHVLYLKKPPRYDEVFEAPQRDQIHPRRTLGRTWYVVEDPDMSPVLLRSNRSRGRS